MSKQLLLKLGIVHLVRGAVLFCALVTVRGAGESHWAFQPIKRPAVPGTAECANPIDAFIGERLAKNGLTFARAASREALVRRVYLDLIGLPPAPAETQVFIDDGSPDAYERLVNRLLASPHYGERWGRHWLDLARFAETDGFEHDAVRPHSWRYRDYVVESFNQDKPYDQLIREQLAGDELWPEEPTALTATGFNLLGPDMVDSSDQVQRRHNTLNDMTDTLGLAFLGLTLGCARCHDHKFEPLLQRDYYKVQAFFGSARFERERPIPTQEQRSAHEAALKSYNSQPAVRELTNFEAPFRTKVFETKVAALPAEAQAAHKAPPEQRTSEQANLAFETQDKVKVTEADILGLMSPAERKRRQTLLDAFKRVPKPAPLPKAMALCKGDAAKTFVLRRGDYNNPQEEVSAGVPEVLAASAKHRKFQTRAELAEWMTSPENPLTARVAVNRLWQYHFGRGLVATPSDFGVKGEKPSHPELLDWLASEFVASGWSIKPMHRLVLMSRTYQQDALPNDQDPENKLYSSMNRVRLEGEVVRDSLLAISGRLNPRFGGPGVQPPLPKELFAGATGWTPTREESEVNRRSIYIFARRNLRFPFLEVFDAPDSNLSCPVREQSTTAPQSLTLLNSDEVMHAAAALAKDIARSTQSRTQQVSLCFERILGRSPSEVELKRSEEFLLKSPLLELCRALFNLNDFVYRN